MFPKIVGFPSKSSILIGFFIINHPFWGTTIFAKTHINDFFFLISVFTYITLSSISSCTCYTEFSKISNLNTRKTTDHLGRAKGLPFPEVRCYISPRYEVRRFPRTISVVDRKGRYDLKFRYYRSTSRNNEKNNNNNNNNNNIFLKRCYPFPGGPFVVIEMLQLEFWRTQIILCDESTPVLASTNQSFSQFLWSTGSKQTTEI